MIDSIDLRLVPILGLLAVFPVIAFVLDSEAFVVAALVNVGIITYSLYLMFGPSQAEVFGSETAETDDEAA